jgi:hypothetical protein
MEELKADQSEKAPTESKQAAMKKAQKGIHKFLTIHCNLHT